MNRVRARGVLAAAALLAVGAVVDRAGARQGAAFEGAPINANFTRWQWFKNTYWYVPPQNLPALIFQTEEERLLPVSDQTVFHITDYRIGYFTGKTVAQLGGQPASCMTLVGSVTPEGQVLLTFTPKDPTTASVTQGFGVMQHKFGQWTMENQMSTSSSDNGAQVHHWAYMLQTRPGLPSWNSLPGSGLSVPEFLAQCAK